MPLARSFNSAFFQTTRQICEALKELCGMGLCDAPLPRSQGDDIDYFVEPQRWNHCRIGDSRQPVQKAFRVSSSLV